MDKIEILKDINYFSSLNEISVFISKLSLTRRHKYILNHIITTHMPNLINTEYDIEQAILIASTLYNGVYALINSVCNKEYRNIIFKYLNQDMNCDSLYIALKHNIITIDIFDAIITFQQEQKLITFDTITNNYLMISQYINAINPYVSLRILTSAIKTFNVMKEIVTIDKFYLVVMAKSIYRIINNIDYELYKERFDIAVQNFVIGDFYILLNNTEYRNLSLILNLTSDKN